MLLNKIAAPLINFRESKNHKTKLQQHDNTSLVLKRNDGYDWMDDIVRGKFK